jgi:hypothetical protein
MTCMYRHTLVGSRNVDSPCLWNTEAEWFSKCLRQRVMLYTDILVNSMQISVVHIVHMTFQESSLFPSSCDWFSPLWDSLLPFKVLRAFAILWKETMRFVMSVCPSVRIEQLGSHWMNFHEIWYLNMYRKSLEKIQVSLKSDKHNGHFTWRPIHIFHHISLSSY